MAYQKYTLTPVESYCKAKNKTIAHIDIYDSGKFT